MRRNDDAQPEASNAPAQPMAFSAWEPYGKLNNDGEPRRASQSPA